MHLEQHFDSVSRHTSDVLDDVLATFRGQIAQIGNTLTKLEEMQHGHDRSERSDGHGERRSNYGPNASNGRGSQSDGRWDAWAVRRVARQDQGSTKDNRDVDDRLGKRLSRPSKSDHRSLGVDGKNDHRNIPTTDKSQKVSRRSNRPINIQLDNATHIRILNEKLTKTLVERVLKNPESEKYGKSVYVVRQEHRGLFSKKSKRLEKDSDSFRSGVSTLIKNIDDRLLSTSGYYKVSMLDARGRSIGSGKLTKEQALNFVEETVGQGNFADGRFQKYMFSSYREASIKISPTSQPMGLRIAQYMKDVANKVSDKAKSVVKYVQEWAKDRSSNIKGAAKEAARITLNAVAKARYDHTRRSYLLDNINNRADAQQLNNAFRALDKSDIKLGNFDLQKWATGRMHQNPRAVSAAIAALATQTKLKAPREFTETIYKASRQNSSKSSQGKANTSTEQNKSEHYEQLKKQYKQELVQKEELETSQSHNQTEDLSMGW